MNNSNELITWSNRFACGIKKIDDQHKELVMLVNEMFNHVTGNSVQENEYFFSVIKKAIEYVKIHFATEEKIMLAAKYEGYLEHKKKHDSFVLTVARNVQDYRYGKRFTLLSFTRFLKDWVLTHIALMDKQYFDYLRAIATRKEDGRLSISSADIDQEGIVYRYNQKGRVNFYR